MALQEPLAAGIRGTATIPEWSDSIVIGRKIKCLPLAERHQGQLFDAGLFNLLSSQIPLMLDQRVLQGVTLAHAGETLILGPLHSILDAIVKQ
jgi:hypothetical protein